MCDMYCLIWIAIIYVCGGGGGAAEVRGRMVGLGKGVGMVED